MLSCSCKDWTRWHIHANTSSQCFESFDLNKHGAGMHYHKCTETVQSKLCNANTWATHIEVLAIAAYFQVPVYFCTDPPQPNTGGTYCWECFNPIALRELLRYPILT